MARRRLGISVITTTVTAITTAGMHYHCITIIVITIIDIVAIITATTIIIITIVDYHF